MKRAARIPQIREVRTQQIPVTDSQEERHASHLFLLRLRGSRSSRPSGRSTSSVWPTRYALETRPTEYEASDSPGVFVNRNNGQTFIVDNGRPYAVAYDKANGTFRVVDPKDPSLPSYPVRPGSKGAWEIAAGPNAPVRSALPVSYAAPSPGTLQADPAHAGIFTDAKGQRYIKNGENAYAVRFDADNWTWRAYQPDNPIRPGIPVKQNADGSWRSHNEVGVPGGNPQHAATDQAQARLQLHQQQADIQHTMQHLDARRQMQRQEIHRMESQQRVLEQEIQRMELPGLPDEIWEPHRLQARQYLQQIQQQLPADATAFTRDRAGDVAVATNVSAGAAPVATTPVEHRWGL